MATTRLGVYDQPMMKQPPGQMTSHGPIMHSLSVSDVERLAKAGVAIKFEDIAGQVAPDHLVQPRVFETETSDRWFTGPKHNHRVTSILRERWKLSQEAKASAAGNMDVMVWMPHFDATYYKDRVYVFVSTGNSAPVILEDEGCLFPSDALMAKIHLLLQTEKKE